MFLRNSLPRVSVPAAKRPVVSIPNLSEDGADDDEDGADDDDGVGADAGAADSSLVFVR